MLPGTGWCVAGLPPFPAACWWLTHPVAITGVSVSVRRDCPGGYGETSVLLLCSHRVHDVNLLRVTVSCSQPEYSGLLMSCQMVDWVSRWVLVSSGSFPLTFLAVSQQGFGFMVSGGGHGLQLFAPSLSQAICSFISWNPTLGQDPLYDHGACQKLTHVAVLTKDCC